MTEEEKDEVPEIVKMTNSIDERRQIERQFFENMKKRNSEVNFDSPECNDTLYIVDYQWLKQWINYLQG